MKRAVKVIPGDMTLLQAKVGIVVAVLFLLFGLVFGFVVLGDMPESEEGLRVLIGGFFLIWIVVCLSIIAIYLRLLARRQSQEGNSLLEFSLDEPTGSNTAKTGDFESRMRKLELLKRDRLITEQEYQTKRAQIINDKW